MNNIFHSIHHLCCHDCCNFQRRHPNNEPVHFFNFLGLFIVKLILEVLGAAGAVWGGSDGKKFAAYVLVDSLMISHRSFSSHSSCA
jgi:hypothetical protein